MRKHKCLLGLVSVLALGCAKGKEAAHSPASASPIPAAAPVPAEPQVLTWTGCGITRKAFMDELAKGFEQERGVKITMSSTGATQGIRDVNAKVADLGGTCRHALAVPEEADTRLVPVAWDALVVVVNKDNPVNSISSEQLEYIFSGYIKDWSELGAPKKFGKISVHEREGKISGVGYMARVLIFHDPDADFAVSAVHKSSGPLEEAMAADPMGIALTGVSSAQRRDAIKVLKLNGVEASAQSIRDGTYRLIRPLYLTIRADSAPDSVANQFIAFALSKKGQDIIASTGTLPVGQMSAKLWARYDHEMAKAKQDIAKFAAMRADLEKLLQQ